LIALTTVVLTNTERTAIAAAARSIRIAFPDDDLIDRKDRKSRPDPDPLVLASMTTDHGPVTYQRFATAIAVLRRCASRWPQRPRPRTGRSSASSRPRARR
jgi:hypothetical protein